MGRVRVESGTCGRNRELEFPGHKRLTCSLTKDYVCIPKKLSLPTLNPKPLNQVIRSPPYLPPLLRCADLTTCDVKNAANDSQRLGCCSGTEIKLP